MAKKDPIERKSGLKEMASNANFQANWAYGVLIFCIQFVVDLLMRLIFLGHS